MIGLDFFDASINRVAAWIIGTRNMQKALLNALLIPHQQFAKLQQTGQWTELMVLQEAMKMMPVGAVWDAFCHCNSVPVDDQWFTDIQQYEKDVLLPRG